MDLSDRSFNHLVALIYETLESPEAWRTLYEALCPALGVKSVHVLGLDKQHGTLSYSDGANLPVTGELAYMQHYRHMDPRLPMMMERPLYDWLDFQKAVPKEFIETSPLYQELLVPNDRHFGGGCKIVDNEQAVVVFSILWGQQESPLSPEAADFLQRLLPHLGRACRISVKNFVYSTQALVGHTLVDKLRQPVILMTTDGSIVHANESARRLLRSTSLIRIKNGKLELPARHLAELLRQCAEMEAATKASSSAAPEQGPFHSMQIDALKEDNEDGAASAETLYAFFTMLAPQQTMGSFGLRPIVMLFFYHPGSAPAIDSNLLFAAFGLTPAECRVATLLAEGMSLKQIAEAIGIRHETVRKQLQSIYQKTSTNRQPELIRLLLHLPHNALEF